MNTEPPAVLVTGASRGLGRGIAEALAREGFDVAIHYATNRNAAEETVELCREAAPHARQRFLPVQGDVACAKDRERILAESLQGLGHLDALVNNAGRAPEVRTDIVQASEASFDELMAVNLKGPYFLTQSLVRHWLRDLDGARLPGGYKLVFVSSVSATLASTDRGDYCISKAGLAMAARLWAARLAADNVHVFELRPGIMATDMTAAAREKYDRLIAEGLVPQGRWGTAADVGLAVTAILQGRFPFSTGEVIHVDGGLHLGRL
jgi:3-oxoacyl-[acyl-carrier protein] reductase